MSTRQPHSPPPDPASDLGIARAARDTTAASASPAPPSPGGAGEPNAGTPAGAGPEPVTPGEEYVRLTDYEQVTRERDEHRADLQRLAADFENFRRRSARDREQAAAAADAKLLQELLAVIDDMERAVAHVDAAEAEHPSMVAGIRMVHSRLDGVLRRHGLEQVDATGIFDPALHEAMMLQPAEGVPDGTILQVLQSGWRLGDRVLRHARVIVAGSD